MPVVSCFLIYALTVGLSVSGDNSLPVLSVQRRRTHSLFLSLLRRPASKRGLIPTMTHT